MSKKLENAQKLYLEGIKQGQLDAVDTYTGNRYTQHSTGVADGAEGFKDFFRGFLARTTDRDIRVIRAIEDGNYVFAHVYQDIDNGAAKWVTTDMFDTDNNDKIVEHWDVIASYVELNDTASGNDVILGEVEIADFQLKDLEKTEANKATIRLFLTDVLQNKNVGNLNAYMHNDIVEHNAARVNGSSAFKDYLINENVMYDFVFHVMGQGDHVVSYAKMTENGEELALFDIYRLENGKIVEHWDNKEPIPARGTWANTGKF